MSENERVKENVKQMEERIVLLKESEKRLQMYNGFNDGKILNDILERITRAQILLDDYINTNIEYVL